MRVNSGQLIADSQRCAQSAQIKFHSPLGRIPIAIYYWLSAICYWEFIFEVMSLTAAEYMGSSFIISSTLRMEESTVE